MLVRRDGARLRANGTAERLAKSARGRARLKRGVEGGASLQRFTVHESAEGERNAAL